MMVHAVVAQFIFPPTNHFAHGRFHSSTLSHGLNQWSSSRSGPEPFRVFDRLLVHRLVLLKALDMGALNSAGGGKTRFSRRVDSRSWLESDETEAGSAGTCVEDMK